jgi:hypothetical protein
MTPQLNLSDRLNVKLLPQSYPLDDCAYTVTAEKPQRTVSGSAVTATKDWNMWLRVSQDSIRLAISQRNRRIVTVIRGNLGLFNVDSDETM